MSFNRFDFSLGEIHQFNVSGAYKIWNENFVIYVIYNQFFPPPQKKKK